MTEQQETKVEATVSRISPSHISYQHSGGPIGRLGSSVSGLSRLHSGGSVGGKIRGGDIHIHNYTDLKLLVKELGSRDGQKIVIDTIKGSRIDLGF
jgi:hypothetical protein